MEGQMMNQWKRLALGLLCVAAMPLFSQDSKPTAKPPVSPQSAKSSNTRATQEGDGERKFQQNCSRCHEAPEGFPSHISGTIVRHMRVRASLSQQDERDILRFLNP
jgi:mono/diheme cytochrome c family protein